MAFEEINTGEFKTYLTKYGMKRLLNNNFNINYFSLSDEGINYSVDVDSLVKVKAVTGDPLKTLANGPNDLVLVTDQETNESQIAKRELVFVDDCNNSEYKNMDVTVYLGNYLQNLRETLENIDSVSNSYDPFIRLFDYVKVYEYTENAFNEYKLWDIKDANIKYKMTDNDYVKYKIFTEVFVNKSTTSSKINYDDNRFKSPFMLGFGSLRQSNGRVYQNGKGTIEMYPVEDLVYNVDGSIISVTDLTESVYNNAKNITPMVKFNGVSHKLRINNDTVYKSPVNTPVFRFESLLESGITAAKNLFEFYGEDSTDGSKVITINFRVSTDLFDTAKFKDANIRLNLTLDLNESNWVSTDPYVKIN